MSDNRKVRLYIPYNDVLDMIDAEIRCYESVAIKKVYYNGYCEALYIIRRFLISKLAQPGGKVGDDGRKYFYIPYGDVLDTLDYEMKSVEYVPVDDEYHKGYRDSLRVIRSYVLRRLTQYFTLIKEESMR